MKKKVLAVAMGVMALCAITTISVKEVQASNTQVQVCGPNKGKCNQCTCTYFSKKDKAHPTTCRCGHAKKSHIGM